MIQIYDTTTAPIGQTAEIAIEQINALRQAGDASHVQSFLILEGRRHVSLTKPVVTIGRALDNDIVIDDPRVSRLHAQLRIVRGQFVIFDLDSTGGTFVNGQRLAPGIEVDLNDVRTAPNGREMDLTRIRRVVFFAHRPTAPFDLELSDFVLRKGANR